MAKPLTIGTIIEKNKIASENAFLILIDADIYDDDGQLVTNLPFVKNSENIQYGNKEYVASNFDLQIQTDAQQEPQITLTCQDQTRTLQQYVEAYAGCVGSKITMTVVNSGDLNSPSEISESFKIISTSSSEYVVTFTLGTDAAVNRRFPLYKQNKNLCTWKYRSPRCGYTGALPKCDYSLEGDNGCIVHGMTRNFGGFPGVNVNG